MSSDPPKVRKSQFSRENESEGQSDQLKRNEEDLFPTPGSSVKIEGLDDPLDLKKLEGDEIQSNNLQRAKIQQKEKILEKNILSHPQKKNKAFGFRPKIGARRFAQKKLRKPSSNASRPKKWISKGSRRL